ncbi:ABC transporter permease [Cryptosporangium sp. NPDC048952]|uniref:ABC transporter permease n=1 Tax=Cryptosporangium sp. NPDC048952 TaxID=3363961 RepID=UPI00371114F7
MNRLARPDVLVPGVALGATIVVFLALPLRTGQLLTPFDAYNALQVLARLGPLILALGLTMIAGEFDLSVVGTYAFGGMLAVTYGQGNWALGLALALAAGAAVGVLQGFVIARFRISSMPVTLATYITLLGLTSSLSGGLSKTFDDAGVTLWVDRPILQVFSPRSLLVLVVFLLLAVVLTGSRWGREIRAIGGDRRASRVSGVRDDRLLVGLFATSGLLAAGGGTLLNFSLGSANPDPGVQPLILAAVAALLGGVSLVGGRGSVLGLLAGALTIAFLAQIVTVAGLPTYVSQLFYALLLAGVVAVDAPGLRRGVVRLRKVLR